MYCVANVILDLFIIYLVDKDIDTKSSLVRKRSVSPRKNEGTSNHYADCNLNLATERTESFQSFLRNESLQTLTSRKSDVYKTKFSLMKELQTINMELIEIDYELGEMERITDLRKNRKNV